MKEVARVDFLVVGLFLCRVIVVSLRRLSAILEMEAYWLIGVRFLYGGCFKWGWGRLRGKL